MIDDKLKLAQEVIAAYAQHHIGCLRPLGMEWECDCGLSECLADLGMNELGQKQTPTTAGTYTADSAETKVLP